MIRKVSIVNNQPPAVLPQIERMFGAAAAARIASPAPSRRLRVRAGIPRIAAVAVLGALLSGSAMAATGLWHPTIGDLANDGPASISEAPVSPALMNALGVLRREPTAQDRGPAVELTLRTLNSYHVNDVHPDTVRYLAPGAGGAATVLAVAGESEGFPNRDALCVFHPILAPPDGRLPTGSPEFCSDLEQIRSGAAVAMIGGPGEEWVEGLVPDQVASVTIRNGHGTQRTIAVKNNYYDAFRSPPGGIEESRLASGGIVWRDAQGAVIPQSAHLWDRLAPPPT